MTKLKADISSEVLLNPTFIGTVDKLLKFPNEDKLK